MHNERTLVLIKPDGVQRGLSGQIVSRLEQTGLKVIGAKMVQVSRELAARHYAEHDGKPFYDALVSYICSSPVIALCLQGPSAIATTRKLMGATNPADAAPGTIRGDLAVEIGRNLVHGSATTDDAAREVALFFSDDELNDWERALDRWVTED